MSTMFAVVINHSPDITHSQELKEPTDDQICQAYREESTQISNVLAAIPRSHSSAIHAQPNISVTRSLLDLLELIELRAAHETLQARNGVRNSDREATNTKPSAEKPPQVGDETNFKYARQQIVKQFYQLLRDADTEGERVGTGLHRSHVWVGPSGNSLNAEKAAQSRTKTVCSLLFLLMLSDTLNV